MNLHNKSASDFQAHGKRIGIFVIAYNAERHIEQTLARIPEEVWREIEVVYVVDDCSTDNTTACAIRYPDRTGKLRVLRNRTNLRYGGNQKLGYQFALDQDLDIVVLLHADGQYAPESLTAMLNPLIQDRADIVLGSRMIRRADALAGGMPRYKYIGNVVLTKIENQLGDMSLAEFHTGYRAYSVGFLRKIPFWENSDEWHFDTHILFQARQAEGRIAEVPIPTYYGDEICHVNGLVYGLNCILSACSFWLYRKGILYSRKYDVARSGSRYSEKFNDPMSSHTLIWQWLQAKARPGMHVLELGVGDASLTRKMHDAGFVVDGVEIDAEAAETARTYCRAVHVDDLNDLDRLGLEGEYDIVLAADVLEHLVKPEYVLSRLKTLLKRDGLLIVSLPNIANIYVRVNLLLGRFPTHRKGLLDETHLHCYTLSTMRRLLEKTGWLVSEEQVTAIPLPLVFPFVTCAPWSWGLWLFHRLTRVCKRLFGYQGLFICRNPNRADLL